MNTPLELTLYSRPGCHLCEEFLEELMALCRGRARVFVRNVDLQPNWVRKFGMRIPVLCAGDMELCEAPMDSALVARFLDGGPKVTGGVLPQTPPG